LPDKPRVERLDWRRATDHIGDWSLFINVVMPDDTPEELLHWPYLAPLWEAIAAALRSEGYEEWPYCRYLTHSEWAEEKAA
jgi:hypothetical protein